MNVAVMQPYIFPYLGYFQLIQSSDKFVFYDDVNFIKKGWINRNRILLNSKENLFTIPLKKVSQNKLINEIELGIDDKWVKSFFKTLEYAYNKAPYYDKVSLLVNKVLSSDSRSIADLTITSILAVCEYLSLDKEFYISSLAFPDTKGLSKEKRLIEITKKLGSKNYINSAGGVDLYKKTDFKEEGVNLNFIENDLISYKQFNAPFINGLSIIDVLMFNSVEETLVLINQYKLN